MINKEKILLLNTIGKKFISPQMGEIMSNMQNTTFTQLVLKSTQSLIYSHFQHSIIFIWRKREKSRKGKDTERQRSQLLLRLLSLNFHFPFSFIRVKKKIKILFRIKTVHVRLIIYLKILSHICITINKFISEVSHLFFSKYQHTSRMK